MAMEGDLVGSEVTDQNSRGMFRILDHIQEMASSILKSSLQFESTIDSLENKEQERLRMVELREKEIGLLEESISGKLLVLEEKERESDLRMVIEATLMRLVLERQSEEVVTQLETQENKLGLLLHSTTKKLEDFMSEFEGKKEEARRLFESIHEKLCELEKAEKDFDLKQRAGTEKQKEEGKSMEVSLKQIEASEKELSSLEEAIKEKSADLKRKEDKFELKQKEEADKWREKTELNNEHLEIKEKTLELDLKQRELEDRSKQQLIEADSRKRSNLESELLFPLMLKNDSDDAGFPTRLAKKHKSQDADIAEEHTDPASKHKSEANDGESGGIVCKEKSYEDPKPLICPDTKFNDFSKSVSSFSVDQVWALYDPIDDMPRIYAQIRRIFSSQLSLQVTLLEHVKTTNEEKSTLSACGKFEHGDTEIKSHLMFAHEMKHIECGKDVIVNPRNGETWALFIDWNLSWNSHPDLHKAPYRYDFVEVISEFDDHLGIGVAYMGRVEGFLSVFNRAKQHGIIQIMISPGEMQRFSHKVASVKLSGEEKEGVPAGSFELNPVATRSYDPVLRGDGGK